MKPLELVMIDPGHGGDDNGAAWGFDEEDDINLAVAYYLRLSLLLKRFRAPLTRDADVAVSLRERSNKANLYHPDLFISIHCDAFHQTTAHGMTVHISPYAGAESQFYAGRISSALGAAFQNHRNRGVKQSNFHVLRETMCPAVLVECEFLSNPETRRFLHEPENQLGIAAAIAGALI